MAGERLTILITEGAPGDGDDGARRLSGAGHTVLRCHTPGGPPHAGCAAWEPGGGCPLRTGDVDVVADIRASPGPPGPREQGAVCALHASIPLVVCGPVGADGGPLLSADLLCTPDGLEPGCLAARSPAGPTARRAVVRAVRFALAGLGDLPSVHVDLELRGDTVVADVTLASAPSATTYRRVRAAVRTALAPFTPTWPYTPVTLYHGDTPRAHETPLTEPSAAPCADGPVPAGRCPRGG